MLSKARMTLLALLDDTHNLAVLVLVGMLVGAFLNTTHIVIFAGLVLGTVLLLDRIMKAPSLAFFLGWCAVLSFFFGPALLVSSIR
jgi:hypothetical protein